MANLVAVAGKSRSTVTAMLQEHIMLPTQFASPSRLTESERKLMLAVLEEAIVCVWKHRGSEATRSRRLFREARSWLLSDEEEEWPFSFRNICDALSLDVAWLRRNLPLEEE